MFSSLTERPLVEGARGSWYKGFQSGELFSCLSVLVVAPHLFFCMAYKPSITVHTYLWLVVLTLIKVVLVGLTRQATFSSEGHTAQTAFDGKTLFVGHFCNTATSVFHDLYIYYLI